MLVAVVVGLLVLGGPVLCLEVSCSKEFVASRKDVRPETTDDIVSCWTMIPHNYSDQWQWN